MVNFKSGILYVVATPIGNLGDITFRAMETFKIVDLCASEDTRKTRGLLNHFNIKCKLVSYNKCSEDEKLSFFIGLLKKGKNIALVSDAGTPLISDPGHILVKEAIAQKIKVVPIPGSSSLTAALSISDLPLTRFTFYGFPPRKGRSRKIFLDRLFEEDLTSIVFESGKRLQNLMEELKKIIPKRRIFIARELTKIHETCYRGSVEDVMQEITHSTYGTKGEFVILIAGKRKEDSNEEISEQEKRVFEILLKNLPNKDALSLSSEIFGVSKNFLYKQFLESK